MFMAGTHSSNMNELSKLILMVLNTLHYLWKSMGVGTEQSWINPSTPRSNL